MALNCFRVFTYKIEQIRLKMTAFLENSIRNINQLKVKNLPFFLHIWSRKKYLKEWGLKKRIMFSFTEIMELERRTLLSFINDCQT